MKFFKQTRNMKALNKLSIVLIFTALLASCDDFGSLNEDPNNPSVVKTELLLTNAERSISGYLASATPVLYVQHMAETQYNESSRYETIRFDFYGYYTSALADLQAIIDLNTDEATKGDMVTGGSNNNQIAVARILKAYFYQNMTDRWGAMPYSEALQGSDNFTPAYDSQEAIYTDLIAELKAAVAQMDNGVNVAAGDFILGGDMAEWTKFANTLRLRLALRMSEVNSALAKTEFEAAAAAGVITTDIMYPYMTNADNQSPWYARFITRTDYAVSKFMADLLTAKSDMRLTAYADPAPNLDDGDGTTTLAEIAGLEYGLENPGDVTNAEVSFPGQAIRAQSAPLPIFSLAEVNLAMAEARQKGWSWAGAKSAKEYYDAGIAASWAQWGVTGDGTALAAYMALPEVDFASGTGTAMNKIAYEKWVALYGNGYEAWAEWRRLDYPVLTPHPFPLNDSGLIPVRQGYPSNEANLNEASYNAAVSAQGTDDTDTHIWWDVD